MSAPFKNIAVIGAGGNVGAVTVKALLEKKIFNITAISRTSSTSTFPDGVKVVKGEYNLEFLTSALKGQDAVVLAVASQSIGDQKLLVDAAVKAGVRRIIPSDFGGDTSDPVALAAIPLFQGKLDVALYVKEAAAATPGSQTTFSSVINGPFFDWCFAAGLYGLDLKNHKATLYDQGTAKFDTTTLPAVGQAVAGILAASPDKFQNEHVYVNSFVTSQKELLEILQTQTGAEWEVEHASAAEYYAQGAKKDAAGDHTSFVNYIFGCLFLGDKAGHYSATHNISNDDLGMPKQTVQEEVKKVLASLK